MKPGKLYLLIWLYYDPAYDRTERRAEVVDGDVIFIRAQEVRESIPDFIQSSVQFVDIERIVEVFD